MQNIRILVLEGGLNEEHEVSLASGNEVKKSLTNLNIPFDSIIVNPQNFEKEISKFSSDIICFNALHGTFGEDGKIQKILDKNFFKYTHSGAKASLLGFNKKLTKEKILKENILTPKYLIINQNELSEIFLLNLFNTFGSFVIKPVSSGSSFGIKIFKNKEDINFFLKNKKRNLEKYNEHDQLLVEKFINGRELTVAVMEKNKKSFSIEVTEIIPRNDFFDYESKYTPGFAKHILPAQISAQTYKECKLNAKIIHDKIKCKGISRSDFLYHNNKLYFLEINSQPGLTRLSLVPEQLKYQNISFDDLVLNLINCAL